MAGSRFSLRIHSLVTALFSFSLPEVPPQFMHLSKKNRDGGGGKKPTKKPPNTTKPCESQHWGSSSGSLAALAILARGNDLTWRSPRPPPARGLGPWGGEWGPGADLLFPAALGRWPPARPSPPHAAGLGCSSFGRCGEERSWLFTASRALSRETKDLEGPGSFLG